MGITISHIMHKTGHAMRFIFIGCCLSLYGTVNGLGQVAQQVKQELHFQVRAVP